MPGVCVSRGGRGLWRGGSCDVRCGRGWLAAQAGAEGAGRRASKVCGAALRFPSWPGSAVRRFSVFIQRFSQILSHINKTKFALCALARVAPKYVSHVGTDSYRQSRCCSKTDCTCDDPVYLNCFISVPTRMFPARGQTRASSGLHLPEPRLAGEGRPLHARRAGG